MEYRSLRKEEITRELFRGFERRQVVTDCLRREQGQWVVKSDPFIDQWSSKDYEFLVSCLRKTLEKDGVVYGAFSEGVLKGFASVEGELFGTRKQYLDLTSLHVSEELRGRGAGKKLLAMAADWAKERGAMKLYISAHSALETQRFYESQGCVDAQERRMEHVEQEPYDRQMELVLVPAESRMDR
ncbi:MAG: GNAT family N-acetyltransferase [Hungatella sp.]|nr:GNAT family N-acetyltransferase [Hungatella sp.]